MGRACVLGLAAALLVGTVSALTLGAGAQTPADLGNFAITATAPGVEVFEDEPGAAAHPEGHGAMPYTSSLLANGGIGYGLASIAWPGPTASNGGALLGLLVPSQIGGQPTPDPVSQVAQGAAPALNYPVRAEARAGSTPDASFDQMPGVQMKAHADLERVSSSGSVQRASQPGTATFGNTKSTSESTLAGVLGRGLANSVVHDVDIGGVVKIKSVTSTATAQTDGTKSSGSGGTVVQGMTVADQPAYVDDRGVHVGEQGQPANAVANQLANQALTGAGMQFYVSQPTVETSGPSTTVNAGSLFVYWKPPNNANENVFTYTFGGARVAVAAEPGLGADLGVTTDGALPSADVSAGGAALPSAGGVTGGDTSSPLPANVPASPGGGAAAAAPTAFELTSAFGGLGWGWLLAALAIVVLGGVGSRRLLGDLLDRPVPDCPLERDR
jgi:hypothetical protein